MESNEKNQTNNGFGGIIVKFILALIIIGIALLVYSFAWIPAIVAIIYFATKKRSDAKVMKKGILISSAIALSSILMFFWLNHTPELTGITATWTEYSFDIHDTAKVKITPIPEHAEINELSISSNIADFDYEDGIATVSFKKEGSDSISFTANNTCQSNSVNVTVVDKQRIQKEQEAAKKAEEEALAAAEAERQKAAQESLVAEAESKKAAQESLEQQAATEAHEETVWISQTGSKYHNKPSCSNMKSPQEVPLSKAESMGLTPCKRCY